MHSLLQVGWTRRGTSACSLHAWLAGPTPAEWCTISGRALLTSTEVPYNNCVGQTQAETAAKRGWAESREYLCVEQSGVTERNDDAVRVVTVEVAQAAVLSIRLVQGDPTLPFVRRLSCVVIEPAAIPSQVA